MKNKLLLVVIALLAIDGSLSAQTPQNTARMLSGVNHISCISGTYTVMAADTTMLDDFFSSSTCAVSLPAASTVGFGKGTIFSMKNDGSANVVITPASGTINLSSVLTLNPGQGTDIYSDGANYYVQLGGATFGPTLPTSPNGSPYVLETTPAGGLAGPELWIQPGLQGRSIVGACGSGDTTLTTDTNNRPQYVVTANCAVSLPTPGTLGVPFGSIKFVNDSASNSITITPAGGWTISVGNGALGASTTVSANSWIVCNVDPRNNSNWSCDAPGGGGGSGVIGGTFGGSPSGGYTFTSTPITTAPFSGNLLIGTMINPTANSTYTAGTSWAIATAATNAVIGVEYQTAGSGSSYSATFGYGTSQTWGGTISAWTAISPALVQGVVATGGTTSLAYGSNNAAGNFLFLVVRYNTSAASQVTSVTDSRNTWKLAGLRSIEAGTKGVGDGNFQEIWYVANCGAGANTVVVHGPTGATVGMSLTEWSGVATSNPLVDYNYNADGTGNTATTTPAGATTNNQYLYQAINNKTGAIDVSGRDHAAVFRTAAANIASTGGTLYHKNGIYTGQTALQETNNSQTNCYVFGIPPVANVQSSVYWDLVGDVGTQEIYASGPSQNGVIFTTLPSAYSCSEPGNLGLSVMWQRPATSAMVNDVIFRNMTCRIPDNQRAFGGTTCFDSYQTLYSSHINTIADTQIPVTDQLCGGLTPAVASMVGYRTNQSSTDEAYFENTWSVGWYTPYNSITNHPVFVNAHAACNQNGGIFAVTASLYGGVLIHYQDIHNITGPQFNCSDPGTRWDVINYVDEWAVTGSFARTSNAVEGTPGACNGVVGVSTGAANGASANPIPFFAAGSGANFRTVESDRGIIPGLVTSNFTSAATTGTTKQTLATYTFAYNNTGVGPSLGIFQNNPGAVVSIKTWGITATNGNTKTLEIDFGGTAIALINSTVSNGAISCTAEIIVSSVTNVQEVIGTCDDGTTHTVTRTAPGITGSASIVLNIAATTGSASGDFTFKGLTIEYVGGQ